MLSRMSTFFAYSQETSSLIDTCLQKDPARRFPDGAALLAALERCRAPLIAAPRRAVFKSAAR